MTRPRGRPGHTQLVGAVDFFADVVASGAVLGAGVGDGPDAVARVLGGEFTEAKDRRRMRRDYGLVEFCWERLPGAGDWHATGFTVQVHRLASGISVAGDLTRRYGPFGRRLPFTDLAAALARPGYRLAGITGQADRPGWTRYWLAEARVCVIVTAVAHGGLDAGDVFSISAPWPPDTEAAAETGGQGPAIRSGLRHLLRLEPAGRQDWLDRRQPEPSGRFNWWLYLLLVADGQIAGQPDRRAEWAELSIWLLGQARARGVLSAADYAEKLAYSVLSMRRAGAPPALLPPASDIVAACLEAITISPEQAAVRDGSGRLASLDRALLRRSRQARNLITASQWHLDAVSDQHLVGRLRQWIDLKQRLA